MRVKFCTLRTDEEASDKHAVHVDQENEDIPCVRALRQRLRIQPELKLAGWLAFDQGHVVQALPEANL